MRLVSVHDKKEVNMGNKNDTNNKFPPQCAEIVKGKQMGILNNKTHGEKPMTK